jgi:cytochrome c-type biogenesis protein CcmF
MAGAAGFLAVAVAAASSVGLVVQGYRAMRDPALARAGTFKLPVLGLLVGAVAAFLALEIGILTDDFSIEYIANNSASITPLLFKIASGWAALEGSILLWGLVLSVYVYTVYRQVAGRDGEDRLGAGALMILGIVALFFFGIMLTVSNPFRVCIEPATVGCLHAGGLPWADAAAALEGRGPNPLLQNHILMAVHPPMLYLGYVGMAVPFAFAMSALLLRESGAAWLRRTRGWTLIAWSFLTIGIMFGGLWSYEVLGWGGYWAWDPVENASFLPWLTATAFLHSAVVQLRRGMLQAWNFVLVIATFALTILGTFLTRSGVIVSVHSFTQSAIGPVLLWFLLIVVVVSLGLFAMRLDVVGSTPRLDSLASREGVFLLNNLLLTVFAVVVLVGTLYPMFVEAFTGDRVGVGRPFFDRMAIPICFVLLLAMGLGPITPYRAARVSVVWTRARTAFRIALGVAAAAVLLTYRDPLLLLAILAASFVVFVILRNLWHTARTAATKAKFAVPVAAVRVMRNDAGYWGGQISHFGVAVLVLGIAISATQSVAAEVELGRGESTIVAGREITFIEQFVRQEPHRSVVGASIDVRSDGRVVAHLEPRLNRYGAAVQSVATPAVDWSWTGDLYLSLRSIGPETVAMDVWWFPFIWLVWVGGFFTALGAVWARFAGRKSGLQMAAATGVMSDA